MNTAGAWSEPGAAACYGAISVKTNAGAVINIYGGISATYLTTSSSWTVATRSVGGAYATDPDTGWEFVKWGQTVIGVNGHTDTPQEISLSQTVAFSAINTTDTVPLAKHIAVVGEFVVMGNLSEAAVIYPNRVRWSGLADSHAWNSSIVTGADYQDLPNGGEVQRIVPVSEGMGFVILENSVYRMVFEGRPTIFRVNEVLPGIGTPAPGSVCQMGERVFFLGQDGFIALSAGGELGPIGYHKVDKTFWNSVNESYLQRMRSAVSPIQKRVYWAYVGPGATAGLCNKLLVYDWGVNRWSSADVEVEYLYQAATPGYTLDSLDDLGYTLDTLPFSLDSRAFAGNTLDIAMFNVLHELCFFSGSPMTAAIETPEKQINPGRRSLVKRIRPVTDGGTTTVSPGTRNNQSESVSYAIAVSPLSTGSISLRSNARYHRFKTSITGAWIEAVGVDIEEVVDAGTR